MLTIPPAMAKMFSSGKSVEAQALQVNRTA